MCNVDKECHPDRCQVLTSKQVVDACNAYQKKIESFRDKVELEQGKEAITVEKGLYSSWQKSCLFK